MSSHQLQNNSELYDYLLRLSGELKSKGQIEAAEEVQVASRFAAGSSSEFFAEAQKALTQVKAQCGSVLNSSQLMSITSAIEQIEVAFEKIGGA